MKFVIITGLSGAGKSQAVRSMEDMGYYCIDNMPLSLIPKFAEICIGSQGKFDTVALVCDIRGGVVFDELFDGLDKFLLDGYEYDILFLDASDESLVTRYKETRRSHPLEGNNCSLLEAISRERELLDVVKSRATAIVDTTDKLPQQLRKEIMSIFNPTAEQNGISVHVTSFGYKYGVPLDADLMFDVRFLPNPFYIPELKKLSGKNAEIVKYVMDFPQSMMFLNKLCDMVDYLLPYYVDEGKSKLVVAIGCTGGRHRSVSIAEALHKHLKTRGQSSIITHRDCSKYST